MLLNSPKSIPNKHSYQKDLYKQHGMFNSIPKYGATSSRKCHGWLLILFTSEALFQSTLFEENYWGRSDFLHLLYHNHRDFIYICISNIKVNSLHSGTIDKKMIHCFDAARCKQDQFLKWLFCLDAVKQHSTALLISQAIVSCHKDNYCIHVPRGLGIANARKGCTLLRFVLSWCCSTLFGWGFLARYQLTTQSDCAFSSLVLLTVYTSIVLLFNYTNIHCSKIWDSNLFCKKNIWK